MTRFGIDAAAMPPGSVLKAHKATFAVGYISHNPAKNWTKNRIVDLHANGIDVVFVFETTADRATDGRAAGVADAQYARNFLTALGAPASQPVYFAVDTDTTAAKVQPYFAGAVSVLGRSRVGVYGSYAVVTGLRGTVKYLWQTYAWSGGELAADIHLHQYKNGQVISGHSVDFDNAYGADFGQWAAKPANTALQNALDVLHALQRKAGLGTAGLAHLETAWDNIAKAADDAARRAAVGRYMELLADNGLSHEALQHLRTAAANVEKLSPA